MSNCLRRLSSVFVAVLAAAMLVACGGSSRTQPPVKHVFVIMLQSKNYSTTFAADSKAPYLSQTLASQGALLRQYYGTAHISTGNYIALFSGQSVNADTAQGCGIYSDMVMSGMTGDGQAIGTGCVYPAQIKTLPDQLAAANLSWKGYMEDLGKDPTRARATCGNPTLNQRDRTQSSRKPSTALPSGDMYAARHNPFIFFHSIVDSPGCDANVGNLERLEDDLKSIDTTANFTWITPGMCHGGHDTPCVNGEPGGLVSADAFLQKWVPMIMASPAYKRDGLLVITFDQSSGSGSLAPDGTVLTYVFPGDSCCNQQPGPNVTFPITQSFPKGLTGYPYDYEVIIPRAGGGRIGAVLLSPFIKPGTVSDTPYNHYSMLRTLQDIFSVGGYLGYAGQAGLASIGSDVFNAYSSP